MLNRVESLAGLVQEVFLFVILYPLRMALVIFRFVAQNPSEAGWIFPFVSISLLASLIGVWVLVFNWIRGSKSGSEKLTAPISQLTEADYDALRQHHRKRSEKSGRLRMVTVIYLTLVGLFLLGSFAAAARMSFVTSLRILPSAIEEGAVALVPRVPVPAAVIFGLLALQAIYNARCLSVRTAPHALMDDGRTPVLYLQSPVQSGPTYSEEIMTRVLSHSLGPVVAVSGDSESASLPRCFAHALTSAPKQRGDDVEYLSVESQLVVLGHQVTDQESLKSIRRNVPMEKLVVYTPNRESASVEVTALLPPDFEAGFKNRFLYFDAESQPHFAGSIGEVLQAKKTYRPDSLLSVYHLGMFFAIGAIATCVATALIWS